MKYQIKLSLTLDDGVPARTVIEFLRHAIEAETRLYPLDSPLATSLTLTHISLFQEPQL